MLNQVSVDDRIEEVVVDRVVDVSILVIVAPLSTISCRNIQRFAHSV